jgi:hypothetical protein
LIKYIFIINIEFIIIKHYEGWGATELNETQKWVRSKKRLRTTGLDEYIPRFNENISALKPVVYFCFVV